MEDNTFGMIVFGIIAITSVLGMTSIIVSFFVPDNPVHYNPDPRYTNWTKPQQTSSGHQKETTMQKPKPDSGTSLYSDRNNIPKLNQGQYDPTATFIAEAEAFLEEEDDVLEIDDDLLD